MSYSKITDRKKRLERILRYLGPHRRRDVPHVLKGVERILQSMFLAGRDRLGVFMVQREATSKSVIEVQEAFSKESSRAVPLLDENLTGQQPVTRFHEPPEEKEQLRTRERGPDPT